MVLKLAGMDISHHIHLDTYHAIVVKYDHTLDPVFRFGPKIEIDLITTL